MRLRPMPVVMVSSLTERGGEITLRALELGAIDFVTAQAGHPRRPARIHRDHRRQDPRRLRACCARRRRIAPRPRRPGAAPPAPARKTGDRGASTGGTEAIREVLQPLPPDSPAILITQHMPAGFTRSFAQRLDALCAVTVREAVHGERVLPGHVYLAPGGDTHMRLGRSGANYVIELDASEPVNRHRPSVDVLFNSAAVAAGKNAIGVILTGMGGRRRGHARHAPRWRPHHRAGRSQLRGVFGMPREAIAIGAAEEVVSLSAMSERILILAWEIAATAFDAGFRDRSKHISLE